MIQWNQVGEIFEYDSEVDSTIEYAINRASGSWANDYAVGVVAIYIIEEWHFSLEPDLLSTSNLLQVVENQDTANPMNVVFGLENMSITLTMQDTTTETSFGMGDDWTQVRFIEVTLGGEETSRGTTYTRELTSRFVPRNILSN